jgi:hypothetical protein
MAEPKFRWGENVRITKGFYRECNGQIVKCRDFILTKIYEVKLVQRELTVSEKLHRVLQCEYHPELPYSIRIKESDLKSLELIENKH